jgi:hypothetical protein
MFDRMPSKQTTMHSKLNRSGNIIFDIILFIFGCGVLFGVIKVYESVVANQPSAIAEIKSGIAGYCLDDHRDSPVSGAVVDTWKCNGTAAQTWIAKNDLIKHGSNYCLGVQNNGSNQGDKIILSPCNGSTSQEWVSAIDGFENPSSALCLATPDSQTGVQLELASCNQLTRQDEAWAPSTWGKHNTSGASTGCTGSEGQMVACFAAKQWVIWLSGTVSHKSLLNNYADGNGYEEWCADFISYVYRQAGYPFTGGERNGWDEYLANNIQNMGFAYHPADGYTPQTGDVAYFDYSGGHVEIVAVGGMKPIFIYGDSGTTDPATGNGDMAENTLTSKAGEGQLEYYLSPN